MQNDEFNTPDVELDDNQNHEVEDTEDNSGDNDNSNADTTDWKAEALKYKAILDRNKNKPNREQKAKTSGELDYGQKAYLVANGVKGSDEMKLFQEVMRNTGKDLDSVLESKYFKSELEELRALRDTANANPTGTKRTGQVSSDKVEYWLAKGEMPPKDQVELRRQYVNAKAGKSASASPFYNG